MTLQNMALSGSLLAITKIVVPIDFSASSYVSLDAAMDIARTFGGGIYLVHVIPMLPTPQEDAAIGVNFYPEREALQASFRDAKTRVNELVKRVRAAGLEAGCGVETGNDVVGNILLVLKREKADMLVISTHGVSGRRAAVFGSIAEKLVRLVECPLLLLRAAKPAAQKQNDEELEADSLALQPF
jgi:nucleotide-binding universal stress UspA family protein